MSEKLESRSYAQWLLECLTIASILIGSHYLLHSDIQSIKASMLSREQSTAALMLSHEQRTDRLYEMFIELLKDQKKSG